MTMRYSKTIYLYWLLLSLSLFLAIPLLNIVNSQFSIDVQDSDKVFSLDVLEGRINYSLYQHGVSGNYETVVVGKEGWLFLGYDQHYGQVLSKVRGIESKKTSEAYIDNAVKVRRINQDWLASKGIKTLFAIAPNKHSIYPEYLPEWLAVTNLNSTDRFVEKAVSSGLNILDLRETLLDEKTSSTQLYYKTDTHWNNLGALYAYERVISELNKLYGLQLKTVENITYEFISHGGGDHTKILKFKTLLPQSDDSDFSVKFDGDNDEICRLKFSAWKNDKGVFDLDGECIKGKDHFVNAWEPTIIFSPNALNKQSVLILRDSFAEANGALYFKTFERVMVLQHWDLNNQDLQDLIDQVNPDIVLYQIVERRLLNEHFNSLFDRD